MLSSLSLLYIPKRRKSAFSEFRETAVYVNFRVYLFLQVGSPTTRLRSVWYSYKQKKRTPTFSAIPCVYHGWVSAFIYSRIYGVPERFCMLFGVLISTMKEQPWSL